MPQSSTVVAQRFRIGARVVARDGERGQLARVVVDPVAHTLTDLVVAPKAQPSAAWPWLVQMGVDRAGWYSWDRLDNFGRRSAERIHPESQQISVGDRFTATPVGGGACEPERFLALRMPLDLRGRPFDPAGAQPRFYTDSTWCWLLEELPDGRPRIVESGYWCLRPPWLQPIAGFLFIEAQHGAGSRLSRVR